MGEDAEKTSCKKIPVANFRRWGQSSPSQVKCQSYLPKEQAGI